jgi:hypothetical protein
LKGIGSFRNLSADWMIIGAIKMDLKQGVRMWIWLISRTMKSSSRRLWTRFEPSGCIKSEKFPISWATISILRIILSSEVSITTQFLFMISRFEKFDAVPSEFLVSRGYKWSDTREYDIYIYSRYTLHNPCGGGVEYLHRDPASRKRRRNGAKKGRAIA